MNRALLRHTAFILGLGVCVSLGWGVYCYSLARAEQVVPAPTPTHLPVVQTVVVGTKHLEERAEFIGTLRANADYTIRAPAAGRVTRIPFDLADVVKPECNSLPVVVQLDDAASLVEFRSAQAVLDQARAQLQISRNHVEITGRRYQRMLKLAAKDAVSESQVDEAASAVESARNQVDFHVAGVSRSQAGVERAQLLWEERSVIAPSAAFVAQRFVEVGDQVSPGDPLLRMIDISVVICAIQVGERDYRKLEVGQEADIHVDAIRGELFRGRVTRIAPILDELGTAVVHIEIDNATLDLKPGMHARAAVIVRRHLDAVAVPMDALFRDQCETSVFVVSGDPPTAAKRPVQIGAGDGNEAHVLSGVSAGESVITTGNRLITDGQRVTVETNDSIHN